MAVASFAPTAALNMAVTQQTQNVALPTAGTPTIAYVQNMGEQIIYVALGSSTVQATPGQSMAIAPRTPPFPLTIGANTNIAAVTMAGVCGLNVTVGN
jgi:hypothetical protein